MENHYIINANGLLCETLNPNNIVAKLYNDELNEIEKKRLITIINNSPKNKTKFDMV